MSLTNPEFAERLEAKVRALYHANPRLLKEYDEQCKKRSRKIWPWLKHLLFCLCVGLFSWAMTEHGDGEAYIFFAVTLVCAGVACIGVGAAISTIYSSWETGVLFNLPVSDRTIFHFASGKYLRGLSWLFLYVATAFLAVCFSHWKISWEALIALLLAGLQLGIVLTCIVWLVKRFPFRSWGKIGGVLCLGAVVPIFLKGKVDFSFETAQWLGLILPTGWVGIVLEYGVIRGEAWAWSVLLPTIAFVATLPQVWLRLRENYLLTEVDEAASPFETSERQSRPGLTEITDAIRQRTFLQAGDPARLRWFERWLMRWLTPKERTIFEVTQDPQGSWTNLIHTGLVMTPAVWAVVWLFGHHSSMLTFLPVAFLATYFTPFLDSQWRPFHTMPIGNVAVAFHGMFPVSFDELSRLALKVNYLRLLTASPVVIATTLLISHKMGLPTSGGVRLNLVVLAFFVAWQPGLIIMSFAQTESRTRRSVVRPEVVILVMLLMLVLMACVLTAFFNYTNLRLVLPAWLVFLLCSSSLFAIYRRHYQKSRIDLVSNVVSDY